MNRAVKPLVLSEMSNPNPRSQPSIRVANQISLGLNTSLGPIRSWLSLPQQLCELPTDLHQYDPLPQRGCDVLNISLSISISLPLSSAAAVDANAHAHAVDAVDANSVDSANGDCVPDRLLRKRNLCDRLPQALSLSAMYNKWVEGVALKD